MKHILTVFLCVTTVSSFGQASKWFVSFFTGSKFAGPPVSIKHHMKQYGYDETVTSTFLWTTTTNYPVEDVYPSLLFMMGKRISAYKSVYIVAGRSAKGVVSGFKTQGYTDFLGFFSGPYGSRVDVPYSIFQLGGGVMYSFRNTRTKLAVGPSFFLFQYGGLEYTGIEKHHSFIPGLSGVLRVPFGREKKLVGVDMVFELNLAPPARIEGDEAPLQAIKLEKVNMIHGAAGLALSFRR